jgi:catechol 2,3-dioxygenase-like lactoylglutathione lyase family enzyme
VPSDHPSSDRRTEEITMLENKEAIATLAVKDIKVAAKFYEETLGLKRSGREDEGGITYATGKAKLFVYQSSYAGTNRATAATWVVGDDVDGTVRALKGRGVTFEHYDLPGMKLEGDVHVAKGMKAAWFKDPDGNIHAVING